MRSKPSTRSNSLALVTLLIAALATVGLWSPAWASHSSSYVYPGAPFSGTWNLSNNAPPSSNHVPFGGDWSTDFYQTPGAEGNLWMASNNGSPSAKVLAKGSSCAQVGDWAGWAYKLSLRNNSGERGWIYYVHVSDYGPPNPLGPPYQLTLNQILGSGVLIGWTAFWGGGQGVGTCYQVSTAAGNHFHTEMGQVPEYACYYPYAAGQYVWAQDWLGTAGSNNTSRSACP